MVTVNARRSDLQGAVTGQDVRWVKSSYSGGSGTECVEAAFAVPGTAIRDSKRPTWPHLRFSDRAWEVFLSALREEWR
ncbi:DUF397 domain-containing protein [Streptomyces sp. NPDC059994]|uniref:DUF397 domain-containing protein n=1 Tax=Streptomyces sp. NPDC059994 TaxID=3347029 RepID=UPI003695343D